MFKPIRKLLDRHKLSKPWFRFFLQRMFEKTVKFISEESFVQHVNITSNTIKNDLINLIKIENYVQQLEGTSLIMRGSIWISLAFELIIFTNLKNIISDK